LIIRRSSHGESEINSALPKGKSKIDLKSVEIEGLEYGWAVCGGDLYATDVLVINLKEEINPSKIDHHKLKPITPSPRRVVKGM
jgi:hypothetical protein